MSINNTSPKKEYEAERASLKRRADLTLGIALILAASSIGSGIFGIRLFKLDAWLNFLQGIPMILATLASGAAVASSFFSNLLQHAIATQSINVQNQELRRQSYERMVDVAAEMRLFLLLKNEITTDPRVRVTDSRAAVDRILACITPFLDNVHNVVDLKNEAKKVVDTKSVITESQYVQQLFQLSSIAEKARVELKDKSIADYIWVRLYPEEHLLCTILIAADKTIAIPSDDQFDNLQFVLREMVPWDRNIDLKSLFTENDSS